jgi:hypothetical protein
MAVVNMAKEFADILTSAFGKGWGWACILLLTNYIKKFLFETSHIATHLVIKDKLSGGHPRC